MPSTIIAVKCVSRSAVESGDSDFSSLIRAIFGSSDRAVGE
jgi:hypothetical protein